ncbi:MAG: MerR family transcriptional regulator [Patescibacteria group bacterium]|nr:MerR family transcriptional regulator [Patescibacteria group bacterium]
MNNKLTIGQVAKRVSISAKTIRYYDEVGLLTSLKREENKYRVFSKEDVQRLYMIKKTRSLGIPVKEIKEILSKCMEKDCTNAETYVKNQLPKYIYSIDKKIEELKELKKQLTLIKNDIIQNKIPKFGE